MKFSARSLLLAKLVGNWQSTDVTCNENKYFTVEKDRAETQILDQDNSQLAQWRKVDLLGKLQNISIWIHRSRPRTGIIVVQND